MAVDRSFGAEIELLCSKATYDARWRVALCDQILGIGTEERAPHRFRAAARVVAMPDAALTDLRSEVPIGVGRTSRRISSERRSTGICLVTNLAGSSEVCAMGETLALSVGQTALLHSSEPFAMRVSHNNRLGILSFEDELFGRVVGSPLRTIPSPRLDATPVGRVLQAHLATVCQELPAIRPQQRLDVVASIVQLVFALSQREMPPVATVRAMRRSQILRAIEARLREPSLHPGQIAAEMGLSLRYVESVLSDGGETPSALIRNARLARCYAEIASRTETGSISDIAYRWGFNDSAHFSRAFKRRYGESARDVRRRAKQTPEK